MIPAQEISDGRNGRENAKKVPRVEKDSTRRPKPRAEWGLLGCVIAFSTLSGVTRESMLLLVTVKENGRRGCGTPDGRLLYKIVI